MTTEMMITLVCVVPLSRRCWKIEYPCLQSRVRAPALQLVLNKVMRAYSHQSRHPNSLSVMDRLRFSTNHALSRRRIIGVIIEIHHLVAQACVYCFTR
jgi:hypothetical protein